VERVIACQANTKKEVGLGGSGACLLFKERIGFTRPHPKSSEKRAWSRQLPRHPGDSFN